MWNQEEDMDVNCFNIWSQQKYMFDMSEIVVVAFFQAHWGISWFANWSMDAIGEAGEIPLAPLEAEIPRWQIRWDFTSFWTLRFSFVFGTWWFIPRIVSGLVHPSYKWTLPPLIPFITKVITHLRFVGWATKYGTRQVMCLKQCHFYQPVDWEWWDHFPSPRWSSWSWKWTIVTWTCGTTSPWFDEVFTLGG